MGGSSVDSLEREGLTSHMTHNRTAPAHAQCGTYLSVVRNQHGVALGKGNIIRFGSVGNNPASPGLEMSQHSGRHGTVIFMKTIAAGTRSGVRPCLKAQQRPNCPCDMPTHAPFQDGPTMFKGGGVWNSRARGNHAERVANHVGQNECYHCRGSSDLGQSPTLHG